MHEQGDPAADRDHAVARLDAACALVREGAIGEALFILGLLGDPAVEGLLGAAERSLLSAALLECRLARGDLAGAMALGHGLAEFLEAPGLTSAIAHHASGELASALGDPDLALEHFPDLDHVETSNADNNTHMNALNERLGYRPLERLLEFQRVL